MSGERPALAPDLASAPAPHLSLPVPPDLASGLPRDLSCPVPPDPASALPRASALVPDLSSALGLDFALALREAGESIGAGAARALTALPPQGSIEGLSTVFRDFAEAVRQAAANLSDLPEPAPSAALELRGSAARPAGGGAGEGPLAAGEGPDPITARRGRAAAASPGVEPASTAQTVIEPPSLEAPGVLHSERDPPATAPALAARAAPPRDGLRAAAAPASPEVLEAPVPESSGAVAAPPAGPPGPLQPLVYVADPDKTYREGFAEALRRRGISVVEFSSGYDLYASCLSRPPDLVVTETDLEEVNGFDVFTRLSRNPAGRTIPVVFLTSFDNPGVSRVCKERGALDYLTKGSSMVALVKRVEGLGGARTPTAAFGFSRAAEESGAARSALGPKPPRGGLGSVVRRFVKGDPGRESG